MLCYVIVNNVTSTDHLGMLRIDCSGKTRLALHVPSSHELESVNIIITIIIIIKSMMFFFLEQVVLCMQHDMLCTKPSVAVCTFSLLSHPDTRT